MTEESSITVKLILISVGGVVQIA